MNKQIEKRIEAVEKASGSSEPRVVTILEHPDGTVTIQGHESTIDPGELGHADVVLRIVGVEALEGRRLTDDELEAKYPGRRQRLEPWQDLRNVLESRITNKGDLCRG